MKRRIMLIVIAFFGLLTGTVRAAELSLEEATRYALAHNPELRASGDQFAAAGDRAAAARAARQPQLDLSYTWRRSDNPLDAFADKLMTHSVTAPDFDPALLNNPDPSTLNATALALRWPVYAGGRISAGIREAEAGETASRHGYDRSRELTALRTLEAYRLAQATAVGIEVADDAVAAARGHADTTARLVREGRTVPSDRMTAELNLAAAQSAREQAVSRHRQALDRLRLVLGMASDEQVAPQPWTDPAPGDTPELNASEQRALVQRRDLKASRAQLEAARARVDAARAAFRPQVNIVASETWYADSASLDNRSQSIAGVVSGNLWSGGRDRHNLAAARAELSAAEQRHRALQQAVINDVRNAHSSLIESQARLAIAAQNEDKARETVRLVKRRYGEARTILLDVLTAERMLVETRNEKLAAGLGVDINRATLAAADGSLKLPE